ncbi:hypothetical protein [Microbacterium sp. 10M-3C3]|uniref:hypothetical protein n=1 Tax=Microbacterium sp. 10M-3C3 TaxID=2483401 RepID=UPI000F6425A1|nr:hypothetical protein [Microbacterium sp. 10M-3C3]
MTESAAALTRVAGVVVRDATWRERRGLPRSDRHAALAVSVPSAGLFILPAATLRRTTAAPVRIATDPSGTAALWLVGYEAYIVTDPAIDGVALLEMREVIDRDRRSRA